MSLDYTKSSPIEGIDRYDAVVGRFFVAAQNDGEGLWHWWIGIAPQKGSRTPASYDSGCALSWEGARRDIERALRDCATDILKALLEDVT